MVQAEVDPLCLTESYDVTLVLQPISVSMGYAYGPGSSNAQRMTSPVEAMNLHLAQIIFFPRMS